MAYNFIVKCKSVNTVNYFIRPKKNIELCLRPFVLKTDAAGHFLFLFRHITDATTFFSKTRNNNILKAVLAGQKNGEGKHLHIK